jgi:lipopolysaccharide export system permease protein
MLYNLLRRERCFRPMNFPYAIYVRDVQGRRLIDVVIKRRARVKMADGTEVLFGYDMIARAREARLVVNIETGKLAIDPDRWVVTGPNAHLVSSGNQPIEVELPESFSAKNVKTRPMALEWEEIEARVQELGVKRDELAARWAENRKVIETATDPTARSTAVSQEPHYHAQMKEAERQIRIVEFEKWMRPSLAFGCLCFAMIGCPVGLWANRADYLSTFVTCFLPSVFAYYPLVLAGGGLAKDGKVPMVVGVWAANIVAGLFAVLLSWRLIRR